MLVSQGAMRGEDLDRQLASTLACVAGAINSAAFVAVGFFSANMTGNVSLLSNQVAMFRWGAAAFYLSIVVLFIVGAVVSTLLINEGRRRDFAGIFGMIILMEAALLVGVGFADVWWPLSSRLPIVVLSLAFLMGLQNAVVTQISDARVRTTHVSGMATDIGIEIGMLLDPFRKAADESERTAYLSRLRLHVATILSFLVGGVVGVLIYRVTGGFLFCFVGLILTIVALVTLRRAANRQSENAKTPTT
jgi:uncharacterized membrane protein YoaK (UPF0700 family)